MERVRAPDGFGARAIRQSSGKCLDRLATSQPRTAMILEPIAVTHQKRFCVIN